ncbi:MAG: hypothetical protein PVG39_24170 [Desulfobacteraceae bacterium]|jgi:hypothetical protein
MLSKCVKCGKVQDPDESKTFVITSGSRASNSGDKNNDNKCQDCGSDLELLTML